MGNFNNFIYTCIKLYNENYFHNVWNSLKTRVIYFSFEIISNSCLEGAFWLKSGHGSFLSFFSLFLFFFSGKFKERIVFWELHVSSDRFLQSISNSLTLFLECIVYAYFSLFFLFVYFYRKFLNRLFFLKADNSRNIIYI